MSGLGFLDGEGAPLVTARHLEGRAKALGLHDVGSGEDWAVRDTSLRASALLLVRDVAVACYTQFGPARPFAQQGNESALAALGDDASAWAKKLHRARLELGRLAPPAALLARARSFGEPFDEAQGVPSVQRVGAWAALDDAAATAQLVVDGLGPGPFRLLRLFDGLGGGAVEGPEAEEAAAVASLVRCAAMRVHEELARAVSGGGGVWRLVAEVEHSGQLLCLSAGKGATASTLLPQIALLTGVAAPVAAADSKGAPHAQLGALAAAVGLGAALSVRFSVGDGSAVDPDGRLAGLDIGQGAGFLPVSSVAVAPEWFDPHAAKVSAKGSSTGSSGELALFISVTGGASASAKARARLAYASLPSTAGAALKDLLKVSIVGSEGAPNVASFQCEMRRHFPGQVSATCPGEKSAVELLRLAHPSAATSAAAVDGLSRLQLRRLRQCGLDGCDLANIVEAREGGGNDDMLGSVSTGLVDPGRKPAWARAVEEELMAYAHGKKGAVRRQTASSAAQTIFGKKTHKGGKQDKARSKAIGASASKESRGPRGSSPKKTEQSAALPPPPPSVGALGLTAASRTDLSAVKALENGDGPGTPQLPAATSPASSAASFACVAGLPLRRRFLLRRDGGVTMSLVLSTAALGEDDVLLGEDDALHGTDEGGAGDEGGGCSVVSSEVARSVAEVALQAVALATVRRWEASLLGREGSGREARRRRSQTSVLPEALRLGPCRLRCVVALQLRMASRWRRRTTTLLDRLREARNAASAWELRCLRLEADAAAAREAAARTVERLESQLRRAKRSAARDAEAAAEAAAAARVEGQKREAAAAAALRSAEKALGDAVLQERQRVTKYWRGRIEAGFSDREARVRSLLAFAGAEVAGIAAALGNRGPSQLDEDRTVTRGTHAPLVVGCRRHSCTVPFTLS